MSGLDNETVTHVARQLGFDLIGFAKADLLVTETEHLTEWLSKGYHADMQYMERNLEKRKDVNEILASAKTVISLGLNYYSPEQHTNPTAQQNLKEQISAFQETNTKNILIDNIVSGEADNNLGKISRYAWGKDYHLIIWEKLNQLVEILKETDSTFAAYTNVDTGPVMDKAWAVRSGIGWYGKNSNIINREIGSWFFIATVICNKEFEQSQPYADYCGNCTACIDACPTNSIVKEGVVDSNKCISYQTIENKGEIPVELKGKFDNWLFGCDICQDVCPWNKSFSVITAIKDFYPKNKELQLDQIPKMEQEEFSDRFRNSPVKRTKLKGLKRNASFLLAKD